MDNTLIRTELCPPVLLESSASPEAFRTWLYATSPPDELRSILSTTMRTGREAASSARRRAQRVSLTSAVR
jgi:hypothetical protein